MTAPVRVQLVDDHDVVRIGFRYLLEAAGDMQVVAESASGKQACRDYEQHRPDIVIMDISMPDISGLEVMRRILREDPEARILVLSMHAGMMADHAMQLGARGFICKSSGVDMLLPAVRAIMQGGRYLDSEVEAESSKRQVESVAGASPSALTRREVELCMLLTAGRSVAEIAGALHLSEKTVYSHRRNIMDKLGVSTIIELAQVASRMGITYNG
ncbi:response regulator transcription factor [Mariprofundus erugo]|uniref:Response regulator transcription factor n=1 Tax=Mariprofundus erugo TaxID=2528639 RepID=A0A5R9GKH5_9PROT|nr:response regulator transcription factor [Mariprofundus erugo]TLS66680.1 response regulator transcription factor [Mariprofundus erugo]TLS74549.1 response regulator transcription factor [Mariprofundus erugo]